MWRRNERANGQMLLRMLGRRLLMHRHLLMGVAMLRKSGFRTLELVGLLRYNSSTRLGLMLMLLKHSGLRLCIRIKGSGLACYSSWDLTTGRRRVGSRSHWRSD
jgi:hypothetical protein